MLEPHVPPILSRKNSREPSVFDPKNLMREARRQLSIPGGSVPEIGLLDPDGDILRGLKRSGEARQNESWACYHTELYDFTLGGIRFGIVGCAVGAPFAVLIAEEMFVSGCRLLISMTSSGQISPIRKPPYFVLIEKSLRDEGTSYHYLPPSEYSEISEDLLDALGDAFSGIPDAIERGATWTTDAPFRETETAIEFCREKGILAVEMEAAALYAFFRAREKPVICFAHVTNQMGNVDGDFEKGAGMGGRSALRVIEAAARGWLGARPGEGA
jgi:uridine phosphorylase